MTKAEQQEYDKLKILDLKQKTKLYNDIQQHKLETSAVNTECKKVMARVKEATLEFKRDKQGENKDLNERKFAFQQARYRRAERRRWIMIIASLIVLVLIIVWVIVIA